LVAAPQSPCPDLAPNFLRLTLGIAADQHRVSHDADFASIALRALMHPVDQLLAVLELVDCHEIEIDLAR